VAAYGSMLLSRVRIHTRELQLQVNSGAFTDGWLIKVKLANKGELDSLLDSAAYKKLIEDNN
jgi:glycine cleavage system H lipoate-binding protein